VLKSDAVRKLVVSILLDVLITAIMLRRLPLVQAGVEVGGVAWLMPVVVVLVPMASVTSLGAAEGSTTIAHLHLGRAGIRRASPA
jgi:hypothetical protein